MASAPPHDASPSRERAGASPRRLSLHADLLGGALLGAGLAAIAFVTTGGLALAPNTSTEIVLTVLAAAVAIAVAVMGAGGGAWGAGALAMFAALAVLSAASIAWSVVPDVSWVEAGRTASYLAAFGAALGLARLAPARWRAVVGGLAATMTLIAGYALLTKVFPASLDATDTYGRLRAPFEYWNATGLIAALGFPPCLWAGARRDGSPWLRGLAVPALALLGTVLVLSYSRGALIVAAAGAALWFAVVPLRLRGAAVLGLGAAGAAAASAFALGTHDLTHDLISLGARTSAGHTFGLVLLAVVVLGAAAGIAAAFALDRVPLRAEHRRRIAIALLVLVALLPLGGFAALAESSRGLTGEVSHLVSTLTSTNSGAPNTPGRLFQLGNSRGRYWSEGFKVGEHALLAGAGAGGYGTALTRYTTDPRPSPQAHSFVVQTFADFGLIGIAVVVGLLIAWALAVRRTLRGPVRSEDVPERAGLLTLLAVVVTFGLHSAIDWTWFIPGTAIPAMIAAGWLAGRGPLAGPVGRRGRARSVIASPAAAGTVIATVAVALLVAWGIWLPLRSAQASAAAGDAIARGDARLAELDARRAANLDPVDAHPLWQLAAFDTGRGALAAARGDLVDALNRQPENPEAWLLLGEFDLAHGRPRAAAAELSRALQLDRGSGEAAYELGLARAAGG